MSNFTPKTDKQEGKIEDCKTEYKSALIKKKSFQQIMTREKSVLKLEKIRKR